MVLDDPIYFLMTIGGGGVSNYIANPFFVTLYISSHPSSMTALTSSTCVCVLVGLLLMRITGGGGYFCGLCVLVVVVVFLSDLLSFHLGGWDCEQVFAFTLLFFDFSPI